MQKLQFEASWEKALSNQDRHLIENLFNITKENKKNSICCSNIRTAINHQQQMLITVLIHNYTPYLLDFKNREVRCITEEGKVAQNFTIPALVVSPNTSMPWTFIFRDSLDFLSGKLQHVEIK